ncbi:MAG TPA: O-antigen ligase family protein [Candidatus Limnocylindrales bacterium]
MLGSDRIALARAAVAPSDAARTRAAVLAVAAGIALLVVLLVAGAAPGLVTVPLAIGILAAVAIVPFPGADRWFALGLLGPLPLLPPTGLSNVPLAAGVIGVAAVRIWFQPRSAPVPIRPVAILAILWGAVAFGLVFSAWPSPSVWLRPLAILLIGAVASGLGLLVWLDPDRRDRWLDGLALGVIVAAASAILIFALQLFLPVIGIRNGVVDLMGYFRGELAADKFADQNNWIIFGDRLTLRAVTPVLPAPNNLGGYLGLIVPLVGVRWFLAPPGRWRWIAGVAAWLGVIALVLTISRSSWLASVVAIGTAGLWLLRSDVRRLFWPAARGRILQAAIGLVIALAISIAGLLSVGQTGIEDRLVRPLEDPSVQDRVQIAEESATAFVGDMLHGVGLGNWTATITEGDYIHNVYLEYGVAIGLFGAIWAVLLVAIPAASGVRFARGRPAGPTTLLAIAIAAGAVFNAVQFLFDDNLFAPQFAWALFWTIGGSLGLWYGRARVTVNPAEPAA